MKIGFALALALATGMGLPPDRAMAAPQHGGGIHVEVNRGGVQVDVGTEGKATTPPVKVSDLVGVKVYNRGNEDLGKIEDLVIDPSTGRIRYAVLSFGGLFGVGDKLFAVPWNDLKLVTKGTTSAGTTMEDHYVLNVTKDALKNAPGFDKNHWPDFARPNWSAEVDRFYTSQRAPASGTHVR
jgi:sporulation protein YlmC with PRC-barrel domain